MDIHSRSQECKKAKTSVAIISQRFLLFWIEFDIMLRLGSYELKLISSHLLGVGIACWLCVGLAVLFDAASQVQSSSGENFSSMHTITCIPSQDSKDPDIHVLDGWMPATKSHPACTIHEDGM